MTASSSLSSPPLSRRAFLAGGALAFGAACAAPFLIRRAAPRRFTGGIVGANSSLGHALRDGNLPPASETAETGIAIVGGGIGGLAAGRRLARRGFKDFILFELEAQAGGNSLSGENSTSAYPWGAHYVPIAGSDAAAVIELFEELGVITGRDAAGLPVYREKYLCADPVERLFIHGRWQEGVLPQSGLSAADRRAMDAFFAEMRRLKSARGKDGRRAFTIPLDRSSTDAEFTRLDEITMADYLRNHGWFESAPLRWYVNYCCRDDYGAGIDKVSAWAGVHYFAARDAVAANAPEHAVVTWPEGNGWFVRQLQSSIGAHIRSSCAVWNVEANGEGFAVDYYDAARRKTVRVRARGVIWAAPRFVAGRVIRSLREEPRDSMPAVYSPWMVANLTLDALPRGRGMDTAWDNVLYAGKSLGYVVATHQKLQSVPGQTVITYYQPLDDGEPSIARQKAMTRSYDQWCDQILTELRPAHPDIADRLLHLDVWLWGHAMARPVPGFLRHAAARARVREPNLVFAHSDVSGISIFEEAYTHGVRAADSLRERVGT